MDIISYVSHAEQLLAPILNKERPNWGYVEQFVFVEKLITELNFKIVKDKELKDKAYSNRPPERRRLRGENVRRLVLRPRLPAR